MAFALDNCASSACSRKPQQPWVRQALWLFQLQAGYALLAPWHPTDTFPALLRTSMGS